MKYINLVLFLAFFMTHSAVAATGESTHALSVDSYSRKYGFTAGFQLLPTSPLIEAYYRPTPELSFSFGTGYFANLSGADSSFAFPYANTSEGYHIFSVSTSARWHPNGRSFYLGLSPGFFTIGDITGSFSLFHATPQLGWMWVLDSGLTFGIELGAIVPIASVGSRLSNPGVLPYFTPLKIGYMF